uniref:Uncharacterized protein n=1 Tax=Strigamia maritima TaxID=126957 RepID=T1IS16_STRMM
MQSKHGHCYILFRIHYTNCHSHHIHCRFLLHQVICPAPLHQVPCLALLHQVPCPALLILAKCKYLRNLTSTNKINVGRKEHIGFARRHIVYCQLDNLLIIIHQEFMQCDIYTLQNSNYHYFTVKERIDGVNIIIASLVCSTYRLPSRQSVKL